MAGTPDFEGPPDGMSEAEAHRLQRQAIEHWGGEFTGEPWMMLIQAIQPLEETQIVIACPADLPANSEGKPVGMECRAYMTDHGCGVQLIVAILDPKKGPMVFDVLVNPDPEAGGDMIDDLSGQGTVQISFYDQTSGSPLRRRVVPTTPDFRSGLTQAYKLGRENPSSNESWARIVADLDDLRV